MCFTVSDEVDLVLPLLLLHSVFRAAMVANAAEAQNEDDCPHQPKPPELIVITAALGFSAAVSVLAEIALVVDSFAVDQVPFCCGLRGADSL